MKINSFNQNIKIYNAGISNKPKLPQVTSSRSNNPSLSYGKISSIAFSGLAVVPNIQKIKLPQKLEKLKGEVYKIELFDKIKQTKVNAFLQCDDPPLILHPSMKDEKLLSVYDFNGKAIGEVSINPSDWKTSFESEFKKGLPEPYLRLHMLESTDNKTYGGVGSTLIQAAVEKSLQNDSKGRLYVRARNYKDSRTNDPFLFYNKKGFTVANPLDEEPRLGHYSENAAGILNMRREDFLKYLKKFTGIYYHDIFTPADDKLFGMYETVAHSKKCELDQVFLDFEEWMYLKDGSVREIWQPIIAKKPIFCDSNRLK